MAHQPARGARGAGDPLLDWLADVSRLPAVETVALSALPQEESLLSSPPCRTGSPTRWSTTSCAAGEGSPFFIEQLVAAARSGGAAGGASDEVPAGIGRCCSAGSVR